MILDGLLIFVAWVAGVFVVFALGKLFVAICYRVGVAMRERRQGRSTVVVKAQWGAAEEIGKSLDESRARHNEILKILRNQGDE